MAIDFGDLSAGLSALNVLQAGYAPDGSYQGAFVDGKPLPYLWDDLRFPASVSFLVPTFPSPTVDSTNEGFGGTLLFSGTLFNAISGVAQMPHEWVVGTEIHPHVHWAKQTAGAGSVAWKLTYRIARVGEVFSDFITPGLATLVSPATNLADLHSASSFAPIDMTGKIESTIIFWSVIRDPDDPSDTYAGLARLFEFDIHYLKGKPGTVKEFPSA